QEHAEISDAEHALENLHGAIGLLERKTLGRLVEHEEPRLLRDRHRHLEQALVAVREHGGGDAGEAGEPHVVEPLVRDGGGAVAHPASADEAPALSVARLRRNADVLARGQRREDVTELESAGDPLLRHDVHGEPVIFSPAKMTSPAVGFSTLVIRLNTVD